MVLKTETFIGGIISYFARHGTIANLLLVIMIVLGVVSITKIRAQFFPDVVIETVTVKAQWKGAGPEDIDKGLVSVLEVSWGPISIQPPGTRQPVLNICCFGIDSEVMWSPTTAQVGIQGFQSAHIG